MKYWIWSIEHNAWWKPSCIGYTKKRAEAGVYPQDKAIEICQNANITGIINESMVPVIHMPPEGK